MFGENGGQERATEGGIELNCPCGGERGVTHLGSGCEHPGELVVVVTWPVLQSGKVGIAYEDRRGPLAGGEVAGRIAVGEPRTRVDPGSARTGEISQVQVRSGNQFGERSTCNLTVREQARRLVYGQVSAEAFGDGGVRAIADVEVRVVAV